MYLLAFYIMIKNYHYPCPKEVSPRNIIPVGFSHDQPSKSSGGRAQGRGRGDGEVNLVVNIIASIRGDRGRHIESTSLDAAVRIQKVRADCVGWTSEDGVSQCGLKLGQSPRDSSLDLLLSTSDEERDDGVEALVEVAEKGGGVEVVGADCDLVSRWSLTKEKL